MVIEINGNCIYTFYYIFYVCSPTSCNNSPYIIHSPSQPYPLLPIFHYLNLPLQYVICGGTLLYYIGVHILKSCCEELDFSAGWLLQSYGYDAFNPNGRSLLQTCTWQKWRIGQTPSWHELREVFVVQWNEIGSLYVFGGNFVYLAAILCSHISHIVPSSLVQGKCCSCCCSSHTNHCL